jgi:hypothetical protein
MDYSEIRVPYINKTAIKQRADDFRKKYWNDTIPVDIEKIIEVELGINIIPIPELKSLCDIDALISSDWRSIYVDKDCYADERYLNRLRYSLAHEIGHYVLHEDVYNSFGISDFEDFYRFIDNFPADQYGYLETQAHKFAGFLLVPREKVSPIKNEVLKRLNASQEIDFGSIDAELLNNYIAGPIAKSFGVSAEAMGIILSES